MQLDLFSSSTAGGKEDPATVNPVEAKRKKSANKAPKKIRAKKGSLFKAPTVLAKVSLDPAIIQIAGYPRDSVSMDRVAMLQGMMESKVKLDPIKVVCENEIYYLIDGRHRITATQRLNLNSIQAEVLDIPRKLWLAYAVKYNAGESLQLKNSEIRTSIWRMFCEDNLDKYAIARLLKVTHPYVCRVTDEVTAAKQLEKERLCWTLKQEGKSLRLIEEETGIKKSTVQRNIKAEETRLEEQKRKDEDRAVKAVKAQERAKQRFETLSRNFQLNDGKKIGVDFNMAGGLDTTGDFAVLPSCDDHEPNPEFQSLLDDVKNPLADFPMPDELIFSDIQPGENDIVAVPPDQKINLITNFEKIFKKLDPSHKSILFVINKIVKGLPIDDIADDLNCPAEWVRNTAVALLYFFHYETIGVDEVSVALSMNPDRVEFIELLVKNYRASLPERELLFSWINNNMPQYRDSRYTEITRREKLYWYCIHNDKPVPWGVKESTECYAIPADVAETIENTVQYFERFQREIEGIVINKIQAQLLLEKNNRLTIIVNQITRILADNATREN